MTRMKTKVKAKRAKLYTRDDLKAWIWTNYVDARTDIEFQMTMDRHFIGKSKSGLPWECLLVYAIEAAAKADPDRFPHPVLNAYVIGQTVYLVDRFPKRGDQLVHSVRYNHNFTGTLRKFDTWSKRRFLKHFGGEGCAIRLKVPRDQSGVRYGMIPKSGRTDGSRSVLRGAHRRAVDAGLIPPIAA